MHPPSPPQGGVFCIKIGRTAIREDLNRGQDREMNAVKMPKTGNRLTTVGLIGTGVWLTVGAIYVGPRLDSLLSIQPNEMGDFLAGGFAPLAFFWLVLGFFQQGEELRTSNQALWLQGEELRNSVEQQRELVTATREGIAAEADRLKAEREAAVERAQPFLELTIDGWGSGSGRRNQNLSIVNHGETCTGLVVKVGDEVYLNRDRIETGERCTFSVDLPADLIFDPIPMAASYVNKLKSAGSATFTLSAREGQLVTERMG